MARKRHLASTARGLFGLCLMAQIEVQWVQIRPIRLIRGRIEIHRTGFLRFLSYDQPRTGHKSAPSVAEQLSIERVLISVMSGFFILHYTAKMGIYRKINANRRHFSIIDFRIERCQVRSKPF